MKCKIPEISWHNRDPVLSVDIQPKKITPTTTKKNVDDGIYRLASGGTDSHVLIWYIKLTKDDIELELAADLTRHQRAVNVVKWSPNGELLASGDDESVVFIWKLKAESEPISIVDMGNDQDKEIWITMKVLRGHMEDVYDLCWAPNSQFLISGSVDNTAMMWDVHKGKSMAILNDHKGFVQGVAWDPKNQYVATLSTDRYLRIFDIQSKRVLHRIGKGTLPVSEDNELHGKRVRYFHDDTLQTFFRRLSFTPDGKLLLAPAGVIEYDGDGGSGTAAPLHTSYVFSRYGFRQPAIVLPCPDQYTVAVRCCPLLYRLRPHNITSNPPVIPLPYRMICAVATRSSVYFYDTQQRQPFAIISNIHYTRLTDVTWSNDGRFVVVSSTDGFCSLITFEAGELGEIYEDMEAVLDAAISKDVPVPGAGKKSKKHKENDSQSTKTRKSSTDESIVTAAGKSREPLLENVKEEKPTDSKSIDKAEKSLAPTPIAIKRKPTTVVARDTPTATDVNSKKTVEATATTESTPQPTVNANAPVATVVCPLPLPTDLIIDKEILSSDEKFESPEKKCRPATPISVRRHPRTPNSASQTPTTMSSLLNSALKSSSSTTTAEAVKSSPRSNHNKRAKPIAVRRTPRILIPTQPAAVIDTPTVVEEAMDAWPVPIDAASPQKANGASDTKSNSKSPTMQSTDELFGCTQDIRLVYEDTTQGTTTNDDEVPASNQNIDDEKSCKANDAAVTKESTTPKKSPVVKATAPASPAAIKTPRRVALKTISTPKSKKKSED